MPLLGSPEAGDTRIDSLAGWEERRARYANTVGTLLGTPTGLTPAKPEVQELGVVERDGYTRRHLRIRSEADDWIPAYLLVPRSLSGPKVPAMICQHQTVAQGKEEPCGIKGDPELSFATDLVERGFVCLAPDAIGFGERIPPGQQPYHDSLNFYRRHPGWSFFGKMIWDASRAIDFLETLPFVDPARIGSIGHSHGAYGTLLATAIEPRLALAVASCGFTTFRDDPNPERWSHLTALWPQLGFFLPDVASIPFDWQHLLALAAPRPLFVWYSTRDAIFPRTERLGDLLWDVQRVYDLHGAAAAVRWQPYEGGHRMPKAGRETAYRWIEERFALAGPGVAAQGPLKAGSAFFPERLVTRARTNAAEHPWASAIRESLVAAAKPWLKRSDDDLWGSMFGPGIRRAWQVWSDGHCPACRQPVPMYEWVADALNTPWKLRCPQCRELFPKNDFAKYHRSGLNAQGWFEPHRADRALLFNTEHPDPADPLYRFGVDDGEGYVADGKRWRFIGAYLVFGQWKQAIVGGIHNLAAAYVATGDRRYAHKAAVLLDRVADVYPDFDFGREGVMYEGAPRTGYVSTWHDACVEVLDLALAYDAVFDGLSGDAELVAFLNGKAKRHGLANPKSTLSDIRRNIEERIFRDTLAHRSKIESNYPSTDVTLVTLRTVLEWLANRAEVVGMLDEIVRRATAVDGVTGEKGIAGYTVIAPHAVAALLGRYARAEPGFLREMAARHPRLHAMYRFHLDTLCLGQYYPRTGDTGSFAERSPGYVGLPFTRNPGIEPSSYAFLWDLYEATGDVDFVRVLHRANGAATDGLPYDLFAIDPAGFQARVARLMAEKGAEIALPSVNKEEWGLAILRSGNGAHARAAWLDYDSGERHGHADAMTLGLFAQQLDLLPDFGYPPVQYGGWLSPRAVWYTQTAAHNSVAVDGRNSRPGTGRTTLWFEGDRFRAVRASAPDVVGASQFERTVALVDVSDEDAYVVDLFRVAGGTRHTKFLHGPFGRLTAEGLSPVPADETAFGQVMRRFQRDSHPKAGWSVVWNVEDRLNYLPPETNVHLRYTDLTDATDVTTAESWVAVGMFGGTAEAWIPSVLVRRQTTTPPLKSTFVGVWESFREGPRLDRIRRIELEGSEGGVGQDNRVAIEMALADGRRDLLLSTGAGTAPGAGAPGGATRPVRLKELGVEFAGDMCLVRFDARSQPERIVFCRGEFLRTGTLYIRSRDRTASFELDLEVPHRPLVVGAAESVESVELNQRRIWPR